MKKLLLIAMLPLVVLSCTKTADQQSASPSQPAASQSSDAQGSSPTKAP